MYADRTRRAGADTEAQARRVAIQFEIAAVAVRYESDTPPTDEAERYCELREIFDEVLIAYGHGEEAFRAALLENAGRSLAWLEHSAAAGAR